MTKITKKISELNPGDKFTLPDQVYVVSRPGSCGGILAYTNNPETNNYDGRTLWQFAKDKLVLVKKKEPKYLDIITGTDVDNYEWSPDAVLVELGCKTPAFFLRTDAGWTAGRLHHSVVDTLPDTLLASKLLVYRV